jgi:hypothetical protein
VRKDTRRIGGSCADAGSEIPVIDWAELISVEYWLFYDILSRAAPTDGRVQCRPPVRSPCGIKNFPGVHRLHLLPSLLNPDTVIG